MAHDSKTYERCVELYNALAGGADSEGMFKGSVRDLATGIGITRDHVSLLMTYLTKMNCVAIVQRGNRHTTSEYLIKEPPTPGTYRQSYERKSPTQQRVSDLIRVVQSLDERISRLERDVFGEEDEDGG